jgi:hypothetical protein
VTLPTSPDQLTTAWLTDALRQRDALRGGDVRSFRTDVIGQGVGFMGQLARVELEYEPAGATGPRSLIAKFPTPAPENREVAEVFRFYEIETRFYEEIAHQIELRTPRCYYSAYDPQTGDFVLLLEDLAPAQVGDQVTGCTVEQAELAIRELAKFHAAWWENPRLAELDWMPYTNESVRAQAAQDNYQKAWTPFVENFGNQVPPEILSIGERFGQYVIPLMDQLAAEPRTIMHGDYRLDNLFFGTDQGGPELAVVDWQIVSKGRGIFDLAYFMTGTLKPEDRRASERDLLKLYHNILVERGVRGYDFDQLWEDYRGSVLFCWLYAVIVLGRLDVTNERGLALFTSNLERAVAAIVDLNAGELLPS